jgi:hypothetical protein
MISLELVKKKKCVYFLAYQSASASVVYSAGILWPLTPEAVLLEYAETE